MQHFEDNSRQIRQDPLRLEFGWGPAFRIAIAIAVVQLIMAAIGIAVAVALGAAIFSGFNP